MGPTVDYLGNVLAATTIIASIAIVLVGAVIVLWQMLAYARYLYRVGRGDRYTPGPQFNPRLDASWRNGAALKSWEDQRCTS